MDIIDIGLIVSYVLIVLCALAAIIIPLIQSIDNPKVLVKSAVGVIGLVVIFIVCYAIADGNTPGVTEGTSKYVGASLMTTYVAFCGAIVGIVYTEIAKILS